jgi:hypothetical protein
MFKVKAPFTIKWEYGPHRPCKALRPYKLFNWCVLGFLFDAAGNVIKSYIWWKGEVH